MDDVIRLGWLPVKERTEMHLLRATHRDLYDTCWPSYLTLQRVQTTMNRYACVLHRNWLCLLKQEHFKI